MENQEPTESKDHKDTRAKILAAALEEFADKGREGARMQAIADRAGVNKALLHYYFRTKEDLHLAVIRDFFQHFIARLSEHPPEAAEPSTLIRHLVDSYMGMIHQTPKFPRIMMRLLLAPEGHQPLQKEIFNSPDFEKLRAYLFGQLLGLQKKGHLQDVDPQAAILSLLGSMLFYFIGQPVVSLAFPGLSENEDGLERYQESLVTIFTRGFSLEGKMK